MAQEIVETYREVELRRDFFAVSSDDHSEFDWVLSELGIPEDQQANIEEITITVERIVYTVEES